MARSYSNTNFDKMRKEEYLDALRLGGMALLVVFILLIVPNFSDRLTAGAVFLLGIIPAFFFAPLAGTIAKYFMVEKERKFESQKRGGKKVLGMYPDRTAFATALKSAQDRGKKMIDKYLVGFALETGEPLWIDEEALCSHACVFAKTGVGKTLWMESMIFQQLARGRASGLTFIDAKRDSGTLAQIILMAIFTGRIEDLVVVDPFDPIHSYNFVLTDQRADVKARKILRAGLPPTSDQSATKHYDRLAADSVSRMVRAMESFHLAWSIHDVAVALSAFSLAYPHLHSLLEQIGARQAMVELGHLASSYRDKRGDMDTTKLTENLRGISSELHAISGSDMGGVFCTKYTDLILTDAILRGKIIYFMLPRLEEAESAARMVKLFREDLEISIGEITSSRLYNLEDPHMVIVDEGSSTFGPTWANLFELARKGRFALMFGAQSTGGLADAALGLSQAFYERVMANVNLKVMMRIGDNKTAEDMAEWFGKVAVTRTSLNTGITKSKSGSVFRGPVDLQARSMGGESQSIGISEDEDYFVSPDELKHEMSAEKGLAWFDLGDGRIVKGRSFWFNSELPDTWEGREFVTRLEKFERDELGLGEWVDEQILNQEEAGKRPRMPKGDAATKVEAKAAAAPSKTAAPEAKAPTVSSSEKKTEPAKEETGGFKINLGLKNRMRGRVSMFAAPRPAPVESKPEEVKAEDKKEESKAKETQPKVEDVKAVSADKKNDKQKEDASKNKKQETVKQTEEAQLKVGETKEVSTDKNEKKEETPKKQEQQKAQQKEGEKPNKNGSKKQNEAKKDTSEKKKSEDKQPEQKQDKPKAGPARSAFRLRR